MKDRIVKESIEELTIYFANNSRSISFPEMIVPIGVILRKFKKNTKNNNYRKIVAFFMELLMKNAEFIIQKRLQIKEKSIKNIHGIMMNFENEIGTELTPLEKER